MRDLISSQSEQSAVTEEGPKRGANGGQAGLAPRLPATGHMLTVRSDGLRLRSAPPPPPPCWGSRGRGQ
ncbi:unnamed protein product [Boreogadus saida]